MDDKTLQALTMLAEKLGTTSEHIWALLLKQAQISSFINIAVIVTWLVIIGLWIWHIGRRAKEGKWSEEQVFGSWVVLAIALILFITIVGFSFEMVMAGIFNPEYWALKQILN